MSGRAADGGGGYPEESDYAGRGRAEDAEPRGKVGKAQGARRVEPDQQAADNGERGAVRREGFRLNFEEQVERDDERCACS